jgi:hypothetical protein
MVSAEEKLAGSLYLCIYALLGGEMLLSVITTLYPSPDACKKGVLGLLNEGDVVLLDSEHREVPQWRWRELFLTPGPPEDFRNFRLRVTAQGANKIA